MIRDARKSLKMFTLGLDIHQRVLLESNQHKRENMKQKFEIIENAKKQARMCFLGIAIPHQPSLADGEYGPIRSEKVLKFNRKALRNLGKVKKEKRSRGAMNNRSPLNKN
jgi:hypothetical protein